MSNNATTESNPLQQALDCRVANGCMEIVGLGRESHSIGKYVPERVGLRTRRVASPHPAGGSNLAAKCRRVNIISKR